MKNRNREQNKQSHINEDLCGLTLGLSPQVASRRKFY